MIDSYNIEYQKNTDVTIRNISVFGSRHCTLLLIISVLNTVKFSLLHFLVPYVKNYGPVFMDLLIVSVHLQL